MKNVLGKSTDKEFWAQLPYVTLNRAEVRIKYQKRSSTQLNVAACLFD